MAAALAPEPSYYEPSYYEPSAGGDTRPAPSAFSPEPAYHCCSKSKRTSFSVLYVCEGVAEEKVVVFVVLVVVVLSLVVVVVVVFVVKIGWVSKTCALSPEP